MKTGSRGDGNTKAGDLIAGDVQGQPVRIDYWFVLNWRMAGSKQATAVFTKEQLTGAGSSNSGPNLALLARFAAGDKKSVIKSARSFV